MGYLITNLPCCVHAMPFSGDKPCCDNDNCRVIKCQKPERVA